ncbi:hypothetical protein GCM10027048_26190 [Hymenobacter coalescens]
MKPFFIPASLLLAVLLGTGCQHDPATARKGGGAYISTVGYAPAAVDEHERIAAHLEYAEDVLRHKGTRRLPSHLRRRRYQTLKLLHTYRTAGRFPKHEARPAGSRPSLLDESGRAGALAYLMEQTGGRELVQDLDRRYRHERIETIRHPELQHWVRMSGLTIEECALLQSAN